MVDVVDSFVIVYFEVLVELVVINCKVDLIVEGVDFVVCVGLFEDLNLIVWKFILL